MPVNPYDDRKVSLRRPHGNGDLDIVGASYTRRKANVTEALTFNDAIRSAASFHTCTTYGTTLTIHNIGRLLNR